ncbi:DNA topoisomerase 3-beta-1 [Sparganum proliferum]
MSDLMHNFGDNQAGCVDFSFFDDDYEAGRSSRLKQTVESMAENCHNKEAQHQTNTPTELDCSPPNISAHSVNHLKHGVEVRLPTPEGLISITNTASEPTSKYSVDEERAGDEGEGLAFKKDKQSAQGFPAIEERGHTSPCGDNASYTEEPLECLRSASTDHCSIESTQIRGSPASFLHKAPPPPRDCDDQHAWEEVAEGAASQTSLSDAGRDIADGSLRHSSASATRMQESLESEQMSVRQIALALKDLSKSGKFRRLRPPWRDPNSRPLPSDEDHLMEDMLKEYNEQVSSNRKPDWPAAHIAVHRPYHSTLNRWRQQERIQFENFMIAHRLRNIKASREISREELLRQYKQYFITPVTAPAISCLEAEMVAQGTAVIKSRNSSRPPSASGVAPHPRTVFHRGRRSHESWSTSSSAVQGRVRAKSAGGKVPITRSKQPQHQTTHHGHRDLTVGDSRSVTTSCSPPERLFRQPKSAHTTHTTLNRSDRMVCRSQSFQKAREVSSQGSNVTADGKHSSCAASKLK